MIFIATVVIATAIGSGIAISRFRFKAKLANVNTEETEYIDKDQNLINEIDRLEQLKKNLALVKKNIDKLDIPVPERLTSFDDTESSLNKLNRYFEKHSKTTVGTEAFILSILPVSQTGEALSSFVSVAPDLLSNTFSNAVEAMKDGFSFDSVEHCLSRFCEGMAHTSAKSIQSAIMHHDYFGALLKPVKSGILEITGVNDSIQSLSTSVNEMGDVLSNAAELSIDPTDMTDLDFSGHIPVVTIAISSFREFNLLINNKTNALNSLKNIGLDAVGAGGGGLVGAKAGALVGSIFGPLGSLAGGIIGGVAGAIGGRSITNEIKQRPLKNAIEQYNKSNTTRISETKQKSRDMLRQIEAFSNEKRNEFKENKILKEVPVVYNEDTVLGITLILYQAFLLHINNMKENVLKLKKSIWYSDKKYSIIADNYSNKIIKLEEQIPTTDEISKDANIALKKMLSITIPADSKNAKFKKKYKECCKELKDMNDKNNSSILVWSYMINGLYQKTLNDIAKVSNEQMVKFNNFVDNWKRTMQSLENKINVEKGKLGLK